MLTDAEKKKAYNAAYYAANREKCKAASRAYRARSGAANRARDAGYYAKNREAIRARQAIYREKKRDAIQAQQREARRQPEYKERKRLLDAAYRKTEKGKDVGKKARARYYYTDKGQKARRTGMLNYRNNPDNEQRRRDSARAYRRSARGRARIRAAEMKRRGRTPAWVTVEMLLPFRYYQQQLSMLHGAHVVDHFHPLALGGLNVPSNLHVIPEELNLKKSSTNPRDFYGDRYEQVKAEMRAQQDMIMGITRDA